MFRIDPSDPAPLYRQIVRQVRDAVASGRLRGGERLPSLRELSSDLLINHLTVKQAYDLLEAEGVITTQRGRGTFIAGAGSALLLSEAQDELRASARELAVRAEILGLRPADLSRLLREVWPAGKVGARR